MAPASKPEPENPVTATHISPDELAFAAEDLLDPERRAEVEAHLAGCPVCTATAAAQRRVSRLLAAEPPPTMPPEVRDRLERAVAEQSARRARSGDTAAPSGLTRQLSRPRARLGSFDPVLPQVAKKRYLPMAMLAVAAALAAGFGGYVVSATAGLNEPTATAVALPAAGDLASEASRIRIGRDVDPHRFSRAWQCARRVTDGRITGITRIRVDGAPALLVYLRAGGVEQAVIVRGCGGPNPSAGPSAPLSR